MSQNSKISYLQNLRCIAAFAVLFLHVVCTPFVTCFESYSTTEVFLVRFLRNLCNWGVPVFVMITGSLLVSPQKELSINKLLFKYIKRFVLVIVVFGTLYSFMEIVFTKKTFNFSILVEAILNTAKGKCWDHMWYIYMTIGLYALLPFLRGFAGAIESQKVQDENKAKKILIFTLAVMFIISSIVPYVSFFVEVKNNLPQISVYIFYLLLGYAVEKWNFKFSNKIAVLFIAIFVLYTGLIQLYPKVLMQDNATLLTLGNESPFVALAAFSIFSLCKNLCGTKSENKLTKFLSPLTFGIYLIHPVSVNLCYKVLKLTPENYSFCVSLSSTLAITIFLSIFGTLFLRKLPIIKKIL